MVRRLVEVQRQSLNQFRIKHVVLRKDDDFFGDSINPYSAVLRNEDRLIEADLDVTLQSVKGPEIALVSQVAVGNPATTEDDDVIIPENFPDWAAVTANQGTLSSEGSDINALFPDPFENVWP